MSHKADDLAARVTELEEQIREESAAATRRLVGLENAIRYLAEDANEETRRKLGRLGLLLPNAAGFPVQTRR
jgi:hypothetical protein